jgi:hypothetical protein
MKKRTTLRFKNTSDIWPVVEKWAGENEYKQKESVRHERLYQKGEGLLVGPMMLRVRCENQETEIEAWVRATVLVRLMSLFILPSEMGIESGGFRGVVPRSMARKAVNTLLAQFGQSPIP